MAKLTTRTALAETPADGDLIHIVDVSDTTDDANGTSKKVTRANLVAGFEPVKGADDNYVTDTEKTNLHAPAVLGTKTVDETDIGNGKILQYNEVSGKLEYETLGGGGDMLASTYDPTAVGADAFDYDNFSNTPTIPADVADLTDTTGVIPADVSDLTDTTGVIPTNTNDLTNGAGFITLGDIPAIPEDVSDLTDTTNIIPTLPAIAIGTEIDTGTDNAKMVTAKAIADSGVAYTSDIPSVPAKAIGSEVDTGTDDAKFLTAKSINDSHNVPLVAPSTSGNVMVSNGTDWTSSAPTGSPNPFNADLTIGATGDYATFKSANDATAFTAGMTVYVQAGTINDSGASVTITADNLTIIGEGHELSIVSVGTQYLTFAGTGVRIYNLRINATEGKLVMSGANSLVTHNVFYTNNIYTTLSIGGNYSRVSNNRFEALSTSGSRCLYIDSDYNNITGNIFACGRAGVNSATGILHLAAGALGNSVTGNTMTLLTGDSYNAIYVGSTSNTITGNIIYAITAGAGSGIRLYQAPINTISGNMIRGFMLGIEDDSGQNDICGNTIYSNFNNAGTCGIVIDGGYGMVTGNNLQGAGQYGSGIYLADDADHVAVSGNYEYSYTNSIYIASGAEHITINGNNAYNWGTAYISNNTTGLVQITGDKNIPPTQAVEYKRMKNTSGGALAVGDVVILKAVANGDEVTTTTTAGDDNVFGIATGTINDNAYGYIQTLGKTVSLKVNGTTDIAIGDLLTCSGTAKIAIKAGAGDMVFAKALEAYTTDDDNGVIDALLVTPRLI